MSAFAMPAATQQPATSSPWASSQSVRGQGAVSAAAARPQRVQQQAFAGSGEVPHTSSGAAATTVLSAAALTLAAARRKASRLAQRKQRRARGGNGASVTAVAEKEVLGVECSAVRVGIPSESDDAEARVAATPNSVKALCKEGYQVFIEAGAGISSDFTDEDYKGAGATIVGSAKEAFECDIVMKVRAPTFDEVELMKSGTTLVCPIGAKLPGAEPLLEKLMAQKLNVVAMDSLPRQLSRAQTYDTLSSMANLAGYRAVIEGSAALPRFMAGQFTAAGKVEPAKVLVIGAGVAGLQAIQAAHNLGAVVRAFDVRSSVKEQIESVGAEFLEVDLKEEGEGSGGYAKEMSKEFLDAEMALFRKQCSECDIVITTALIPGKPAPKLIKQDMVDIMRRGSVVVDLAAANGGNCEATVPGKKTVTENGVTVLGTDMVQSAPAQASELFSNNVSKFLISMGDKGRFHLNEKDEAVRGCWIIKDGERLPEPEYKPPTPPPPKEEAAVKEAVVVDPKKVAFRSSLSQALLYAAGVSGLLSLGRVGGSLTSLATTLSLACLVGAQVVTGVSAALHSPLMSVTNAISGLTVVGGILMTGGGYLPKTVPQILAAIAVLVSMVNVGGGFVMTGRMLQMFRRESDPPSYSSLLALPAGILLAACFSGGARLAPMAYLVSSLLCIRSIGALSSQKTAPSGNALGIMGVAGGLAGTICSMSVPQATLVQMLGTMTIGGGLGVGVASRVEVTDLPQLVAAFHSLVGVAAACTAIASALSAHGSGTLFAVSTYIAASIGALTVTGSLLAFAKLQGLMSGRPMSFPGQKPFLALLFLALNAGLFSYIRAPGNPVLLGGTAVAAVLGWIVAGQVGGADMPVVITLLNSASGWALTAEGFVLSNALLTIVGALIGSSGAILSAIMCTAMNRTLADVLGLQRKALPTGSFSANIEGECTTVEVDSVAAGLETSKKVVIVPGYGVAVSKGQYALAEIMQSLTERGVKVKVAIHPVAGRMPGQLNVLLAEAGIPYDQVFEMEELNEEGDWNDVDMALVVGANDTVNSLAEDDPSSPIAGMPVIRVWKAKKCIVMKRSLGVGYAALENPVFYNDNTDMLLGDAKARLEALRDHLRMDG